MSDQPTTDDALRQRLSELGRKGGKTMTAAKREQLALARNAKDFYRRHPDQHPSRKQR